jgi:hypothetical protein
VTVSIFFLNFLDNLSFFHGFDQRLAFLADSAFSGRDALLLSVDVALQALQIVSKQEHIRASEALMLLPALFLETLAPGVLFISQNGLFVGERLPCL